MADWMVVALPLLALPIVLLFRFIGCTKFGTAPSETPKSFTMAVSKPGVSLTPGGSTSVTVTVTSVAGYVANTDLKVTGLPAGVTGVFASTPVAPAANQSITSTLTLTAAPTAAAGATAATVTGTSGVAPNQISGSVAFAVTVTLPTPDFSLSLTPTSRTAASGQTVTYTVNISRVGGFAEAVTLTTTPVGGTFAPQPATGNTSTLTANLTGAAPGTYTFTVTGRGTSGATRTTNGTTIVT